MTREENIDTIVAYFQASLIWSLGAVLTHLSREKFNVYFQDLIENNNLNSPK